jgi:hypothetical protein
MTHEELMDIIDGVMSCLLWLVGVVVTIVLAGVAAGYAVESLAQERIESAQYVARCSK